MKIYRKYFVLLSLTLLVVAGCAHFFKNPRSEETLRERITKEWTARINRDWGTVYDLAWKEFREKSKRDDFMKKANLEVERFSIEEVHIDAEKREAWAKVNFDVNTQFGIPFKGITAKEEWIWEDGEWRLKLKPFSPPF